MKAFNKKRVIAFLMILALTLGYFCGIETFKPQAATTVSSLEQRYEELEKQLSKLQNDMKKTQNEKSQQLKYKNQIDSEITLVEAQIDNLNSQVVALNNDIAKNQKLLDEKENEISENDELFKARLRAMYMAGETSVWEVLLGSKSFSQFLKNAEYMKRLAESDQQLMSKLNQDKQSIVAAKQVIEQSKAKLVANKATLDTKKASLDKKYKESQRLLNTLIKDENSLAQQQIKINEEMEKIDEEIRQMLEANGSSGEFVGGKFGWPVPNYSTITSKFGWRTLYGKKNWHTGIDISGSAILGKPIVASNAGTVIKAVTTYVPKKGYGKYVMIDHGGGYTTMYAHCTSLAVTVGQKVNRGQTIAYVGSTGNSTGPHLHFGIYINGKEVDPLGYL